VAGVQITDPEGDGHHAGSDVRSAWFSEDSGLQATIKVTAQTPQAEHDDADVNGAGFVMLFTVGGQTHYVRALLPYGPGAAAYDYGTYTPVGGFVSGGSTTGFVSTEATGGSVTVDVPAATGATGGALLDDPFVLTYDGIIGGVPTWVDHGPGGTAPGDAARGADFVVGTCDGSGGTTVAVQLHAPKSVKGGHKKATISGKVLPARAGVAVAISRKGAQTIVSNTVSAADGTFSVTVPVRETTRVQATAESISSQTLTITMRSVVSITGRRLASGAARITGLAAPFLPGKLLLLRTDAARPSAVKNHFKGGTFTFRLPHLRKGRYQVVFVPAKGRAERSTSNVVRIPRPASG
jgi:hypothetical protein